MHFVLWYLCIRSCGGALSPSMSNDWLATLDRPNWMEFLVMEIALKLFPMNISKVFPKELYFDEILGYLKGEIS